MNMNSYAPLRNGLTAQVEANMALTDKDMSMNFPKLIMKILSDETSCAAVSWLPHGLSFRIHDRKAFLEFLSEYERCYMPGKGGITNNGTNPGPTPTRTIKWTSLTRKMCRWNIVRMTSGADAGAYYHPKMQRDYPELAEDMIIGKEGAPAAIDRTAMPSQFAQAKAKILQAQVEGQMQAQLARAQQQLARHTLQMQAHQQKKASPFRLHPSAPLMAASHLPALARLQEVIRQSKLAALRAGPVFGFDAKAIDAELNPQQSQQSVPPTSTIVAAPATEAPERPQATALRPTPPTTHTMAQSITQSILAAASASASAPAPPPTGGLDPLALSIQQEEERIRLLTDQIRLGQERQRQVAAMTTAMAAGAKVDVPPQKVDLAGGEAAKATLNRYSNAQA